MAPRNLPAMSFLSNRDCRGERRKTHHLLKPWGSIVGLWHRPWFDKELLYNNGALVSLFLSSGLCALESISRSKISLSTRSQGKQIVVWAACCHGSPQQSTRDEMSITPPSSPVVGWNSSTQNQEKCRVKKKNWANLRWARGSERGRGSSFPLKQTSPFVLSLCLPALSTQELPPYFSSPWTLVPRKYQYCPLP